MLAIALIIAIVYCVLNSSDDLPKKDPNKSHSFQEFPSFKACERRLDDHQHCLLNEHLAES